MNKVRLFLKILFLSLYCYTGNSQTIDSTNIFSMEKYLDWVRTYHPVMQQSKLLARQADASLMKARGGFDPKLYGDHEHKTFDEKNYFRVGEAGLKIPTWWGVDVKLAYLWSDGIFNDPSNNIPTAGQAVVGVEVPLLQGLVFDRRRAQVQQANLMREANEADRQIIVNDLLMNAIETYWEWAFQYQVTKVYRNSLALAEVRFSNVKESFLQGDKPAIDTLESMIQIQDRELQLQVALQELETARLALSNYLWFEELTPVEVPNSLQPELWNQSTRNNNLITENTFQNISQTHPLLQRLNIKQKELEIKEKLKREQFKPQLNFNYNLLGDGLNLNPNNEDGGRVNHLLTENYKWGVNFSFPLLLRKERAGLELVRIEQLDTRYKMKNKTLELNNKIRNIFQQMENTQSLLDTQQDIYQNYQRLLDAENEKFKIGESSIFLLNSREQKLINTELKLNKLHATFQKLQWKLDWARGILQ